MKYGILGQPPNIVSRMSGRSGHRRVATVRFAGLTEKVAHEEDSFYVLGLPSTIFQDDDTAKILEDGRHLQQATNGVLVDRFDVRLLLDSLPLPSSKLKKLRTDRTEEAELDEERYHDLDPAREHELELGRLMGTGGKHRVL